MQNVSRKTWERQLKTALSKMGTDWLNANLMEWFQYVDPCPTADQFVQMCSATKFGGEQNPLTLGGVNFMLTGVLGGLHYLANQGKIQELGFDKQKEPAVYTKVATPYIFANTLFSYEVDKLFIEHVGGFEVKQFEQSSFHPNIFLDKDTRAFGLYLHPLVPFKSSEVSPDFKLIEDTSEGYSWDRNPEKSGFTIGEFHSGPMQYISRIDGIVSSVDRLIKICSDRPKHKVKAHDRHLASGKITKIPEQTRRNRLTKEAIQNEITDHVVYIVRDIDGVVRYIGEGTRDRPAHVTSGVSSN